MKTVEGCESWLHGEYSIYIVTSPPRTGTTSVCKMAEMCGMKPMHVLRGSFRKALEEGHVLFSDTPFYVPEFLCGLLESLNCKVKFIYCHRDADEWRESMKRLEGIWRPGKLKNRLGALNDLCYEYMDSDLFIERHYKNIKKVSEAYGVQMLDYRFGDGWAPFCDFVGKPEPDVEVPHMNNKTAKPYEYQSRPE